MDGIEGLLARDFGVRPQGKAAPMAASRGAGSAWPNPRSTAEPAPSYDGLFRAPAPAPSATSPSLDSFLDSFKGPATSSSFKAVPGLWPSDSTSSATARYDGDDVFRMAGAGAAPAYDHVFTTNRSAPPSYDDLLGEFAGKPAEEKEKKKPVAVEEQRGRSAFDDLIPGFAESVPPKSRKTKRIIRGAKLM